MQNIIFLGDFYYDYENTAQDVISISKWIKENNFRVILNLEAPLYSSKFKIKKRGPNLFQSMHTIEILKMLNVVGVCLANNHIMDYGYEALEKTIELLDENGIMHTGAGKNVIEANKPIVLRLNNSKNVIIQNFAWDIEEAVYATNNTPGCSPRNDEFVLNCSKELHRKHPESYLINIFHWGFEYNHYPLPIDINLGRSSIDFGIDLVLGGHSHNVQSFETYKNKKIYYSLGNFYFSSMRKSFKKIRFKSKISNLCDYGIIVELDSITSETKEHFIFYNIEKDKSAIIKEHFNINELIDDISTVNSNSRSYIKKVRKNNLNITPILTKNAILNSIKLHFLSLKYFTLFVLRKIKKAFIK